MNHLHEEALVSKWSQTTDIAILERSRVRALEECQYYVKEWDLYKTDPDIAPQAINRAICCARQADAIAKEIDSYKPKDLSSDPRLVIASAELDTESGGVDGHARNVIGQPMHRPLVAAGEDKIQLASEMPSRNQSRPALLSMAPPTAQLSKVIGESDNSPCANVEQGVSPISPATTGDVISEPDHKQTCGSTGQVAGGSLYNQVHAFPNGRWS